MLQQCKLAIASLPQLPCVAGSCRILLLPWIQPRGCTAEHLLPCIALSSGHASHGCMLAEGVSSLGHLAASCLDLVHTVRAYQMPHVPLNRPQQTSLQRCQQKHTCGVADVHSSQVLMLACASCNSRSL
jgi:hypothetical protein